MRSTLSLFSLLVVTSSTLAQTVRTIEVCGVGTLAYISASGNTGGCGSPNFIFENPNSIRCPTFSFFQISVGSGPSATNTFRCPDFPSICPPGFSYDVLDLSGSIGFAFICRVTSGFDASVAAASCSLVGGSYSSEAGGSCSNIPCSANECSASPDNCRLFTLANTNDAPIACSAIGSICLNFDSGNGYAGYACGVPCGNLACYDTTPSVQVCNTENNRCDVCASGTRSDALTCFGGAVSGSQAPTRRRDRLLKERKDKIAREHALCPIGLTPCSVGFGRDGAYECLDTQSELESCGGCRSSGLGTDCSALAGVRMGASTCDGGKCVISACLAGFKLKEGRCV